LFIKDKNMPKASQDAGNGFFARMKANFQGGYSKGIEQRHGAQPQGVVHKMDQQTYWEERAKLATEYAQGNAEHDRLNALADGMEGNERAQAKQAAWAKWVVVRDKVGAGAEDIGATLENVEKHVDRLKSGDKTVLPPATGFPSAYGGARYVQSLQRNLKQAGLKPYRTGNTGIPQAPTPP
jgi:hypothetical protein